MGYKFVKAPEDYPGLVYGWGKRVLEHHLVWWLSTGEVVPSGHVLHHKNDDPADNRFENLELKLRGKHTTDHQLKEPPKELSCAWCKKPIIRNARDVRSKRSQGQTRFFCCSAHAALAGWKDKGPSSNGKTQPLHG